MTVLTALAAVAVMLSACGSPAASGQPPMLQVIAGENFWGSIAVQLGGDKVSVTSIVSNPNADPHDYESSTSDARAFATADYVILNGAGYDDWGSKLLAANPNAHRKLLTVADLIHKKAGDNPHFWYDPTWVERVADAITDDYKAIDAADAGYFDQQRAMFKIALRPYHMRIASIRSNFSGVPVGSTESILVYMAEALGLDLISPPEFMQAVAEGNDPPANAVAQFHDQVANRQIKVLVYNSQTSSNLTDSIKKLARDEGIPIVGVSETLQPADATFQEWQDAQLLSLQNALNAGALTH
jgi:zinc/manganese transport system substrate-binding protein